MVLGNFQSGGGLNPGVDFGVYADGDLFGGRFGAGRTGEYHKIAVLAAVSGDGGIEWFLGVEDLLAVSGEEDERKEIMTARQWFNKASAEGFALRLRSGRNFQILTLRGIL